MVCFMINILTAYAGSGEYYNYPLREYDYSMIEMVMTPEVSLQVLSPPYSVNFVGWREGETWGKWLPVHDCVYGEEGRDEGRD